LGRRIVGQCRQMISLSRIEGEPHNSSKRKIFVSKSNSVIPPEISMTMMDNGNEYESNNLQSKCDSAPRQDESEWLKSYLKSGKKPLDLVIEDSLIYGLNADFVRKVIPIICNQDHSSPYNWIKLVKRE